MSSMFLAGPFKSLVDPSTQAMSQRSIAAYTSIIDHFEKKGWHVHCAHRREGWGREFMPPETCTRIDFDEISRCDVFVAYPGAPASPGTHIEIGWASALGKPIVLLLDPDADYAFLVQGIGVVAAVERVFVRDNRPDTTDIEDAIGRLLTDSRS